ncbi:hypothetical protein WOLCODRAFT_29119 [Wolfiporia cocos MD-104 SS10]|uniref:BZIP domain-containing protein n=1 Tax=Wolfiporia cocos (strain MD-104) TaxID=742152 RepID=A0A2H3JIA2_WOLCO|nr:hypothetical protein WOLCODRAFT_29119 [Wolfiporia cocos MD-104 SS10]
MTTLTGPYCSSDSQSILSQSDRPERSRNAKAQARHRAKRKAYIEQLEQTVTKLQTVLALSPDQVAALPPPLVRIRELEEENELLHREIDGLRRQLEMRNARLRPDIARRSDMLMPSDIGREARRRRLNDTNAYMYHPPSSQSSNTSDTPSPPPPLMIPSSTSHLAENTSMPAYPRGHSSSLVSSSYGMLAYQMPPDTPTTSSPVSSPSFSAQ